MIVMIIMILRVMIIVIIIMMVIRMITIIINNNDDDTNNDKNNNNTDSYHPAGVRAVSGWLRPQGRRSASGRHAPHGFGDWRAKLPRRQALLLPAFTENFPPRAQISTFT